MQVTASAVDKSGRPATWVAALSDRAVIGVAGPDAEHFLQGILTQDMDRLADEAAIYAGLLSPQGKILFDFFVARAPDGFVIEVAADKAADLIKRLTMYRLKAKVLFTDHSGDMRVLVVWGAEPGSNGPTRGTLQFTDPRLPALGLRILAPAEHASDVALATNGIDATAADWHAHRIALGVPEGGKDFAYGDAFPHEADMDQLAGVSFDKGCYVGQEVVSRMQHRGTARKRVVIVKSDGEIAPGAGITAGSVPIGTVASSAGRTALALVRLDRAAEAAAKGVPLVAGGLPVTIAKQDWARFELVPQKTVDEGP